MLHFFYCIEVQQVLTIETIKLFTGNHFLDMIKRVVDEVFLFVKSNQDSGIMFYIEECHRVGGNNNVFIVRKNEKAFFIGNG